MKIFILWIVFSVVPFSAQATFLPDADLNRAAIALGPPNITEPEFQEVIRTIQNAYAEIVKSKGGSLSISGDWKSEKLNAAATQMGGSWRVVITGALARRPELTKDGFSLILCHELGHHLAGFPFAADGNPFQKTWAANEGQADYFSTHACARKLWIADHELNASYRATVPMFVQERCDTAWPDTDAQNLCYRIGAGVKSVAETMAGILNKPAPTFETPDATEVAKTSDAHPPMQCRMDTIFQAAICPAEFGEDLIPGKTARGGVHSVDAERESASRTCTAYSGHVFGLRSRCWFKPRM